MVNNGVQESVYAAAATMTLIGVLSQLVATVRSYRTKSKTEKPIPISVTFLSLVLVSYLIYATYAIILLINNSENADQQYTGLSMLIFTSLGFFTVLAITILVVKKNRREKKAKLKKK